MPAHDWTQVPAGIFHHFHLEWIASIAHALNHGLLPKEYYALAEISSTNVKARQRSDEGFYRARKRIVTVRQVCDDSKVAQVDLLSLEMLLHRVGDRLPDMPLFLEAGGCVEIPLEATYQRAFAEVPERWRDELD